MAGAAPDGPREADSGNRFRLLVFRLDGREHAIPLEHVLEVFRMVAVTPLLEAPSWVRGVIDIRGRVVPVIDLRVKLGMPVRETDLSTPIVMVETGSAVAGLVIDEVLEVLSIPSEAVVPLDPAAGPTRVLTSLARMGGRLVLVLDTEALCEGSGDLAELGSYS
jgi:purine-binding chemotaxis protein CheW